MDKKTCLNKMNKFVPIILIISSILLGAIGLLLWRSKIFHHIKVQADCVDPQKLKFPEDCKKDPNCCGVWDDNMKACIKSKMTKGVCSYNIDPIISILYILALILFIAFIVTLVMVVRQK